MSINKHITDNLNVYLDLTDPEYAFLISGEWGVGKTFFINSFIKDHKKNKDDVHKIIKVSLFGLKSVTEINEKMFQALHPLLGSKHAKFIGNFLKGAIGFRGNIDLYGDDTPDGSLNSKLDFTDYLSIDDDKPDKEIVLIIDDLERSNIPMTELLGYINYLVEVSSNKVILLANESSILENDKNKLYTLFKEKVIGKTFEVNHDIDVILCELLKTSENKLLHRNIEVIKDVYNKSETKNIRKLKQSISDFDYLSAIINSKYFEDTTFTTALVKTFFAINIEAKRGALTEENLSGYGPIVNITHNENLIFEKYRLNDAYLYSAKIWADIVFRGKLDEVNDATSKLAFFLEKPIEEPEPLTWKDLRFFNTLESNEFVSLIEIVKNDILEIKNDTLINYLNKLDLLIYFTKNSLIEFNISELDKLVREFIFKYKSNDDWKEQYSDGFSQFNFLSESDEDFEGLKQLINKEYKIVYKKNNQDEEAKKIKSLKSEMERDLKTTIDMLLKTRRETTIFQHIDSNIVVENLFSTTNKLLNQFKKVLSNRYLSYDSLNNKPYSFYLSSELKFWEEVQSKLEVKLQEITNKTLNTHILMQFSKVLLTDIISRLSSNKT